MSATAMAFRLDGATRLIPVLGDPVTQVRSPSALTERLQRAGINAVNLPLHVEPGDLAAVVDALKRAGNVPGFIFTVPHKIAAVALADTLTPVAEAAGSINVLRREPNGRWLGDNLDGRGFVEGLRADGHDPRGRSAMIVGAGGVGSAIAAALADAGIGDLALYDLDRDKCERVARRLRALHPELPVAVLDVPDGSTAEVAVNATSLGLRSDDPLPFDLAPLRPGTVVAEVVMNPPVTPLLERARAAGLPVALGENVFVHQLERMVAFFGDASR